MLRCAILPWLGLMLPVCFSLPLRGQAPALRLSEASGLTMPGIAGLSAYHILALENPEALADRAACDTAFALEIALEVRSLRLEVAPAPESRPRIHLLQEGGLRAPVQAASRRYRGRLSGADGGELRLGIGPDHLGGGFIHDGRLWHLEPLWWHAPGAPAALYLLYAHDALHPDTAAFCGCLGAGCTIEDMAGQESEDHSADRRAATGCREVDYTVAADWLFFDKYGSPQAAEARIQTVMALVELQYSGHFANEYLFLLNDIQLSACPSCDPPEWTGTTNAANLLINFRDWAEAGGLGGTYDVAGLWTGRTFDNGLVGVAYIEGVCNTDRYQSISDFSANSGQMRWLVSHEFGHNFSSQHDPGSGFIMSPTVNASTQWSGQSKTAINQYSEILGCLEHCIIIPPPLADFTATPTEGCAPLAVQFSDLSIQDPSTWQWSFPGGTPSSSNAQHPEVSYGAFGEFPVTLIAGNAYGADTLVRTAYIRVADVPVPAFDWVADGRTVYFEDRSERAENWHWDFGDGSESTLPHPVHTYAADGTRVVTLQAGNGCGTASVAQVLTLWTPPLAAFGADTLSGCAPLEVRFQDSSSANVTAWRWQFPGGVPDTAIGQVPPVVHYGQPGVYTVRLVVSNPAGSDTLERLDYVQVHPWPDTPFSLIVRGDSLWVAYPGQVDSLYWAFGDGGGSDEAETYHVYAQPGEYALILTLWSVCGRQDLERTILIHPPPRAGFSAEPLAGCVPLTVILRDTSSGHLMSRNWWLPGADPETSTDSVVTATYVAPGWYDVLLIVDDGARADTLERLGWIRVADPPEAAIQYAVEGLQVRLQADGSGADAHYWDLGDGTTAEGDSLVHTYALSGEYTVRLVAENVCATDTAWVEVQVVLSSISGVKEGLYAEIWPNPASERMFVRVQGAGGLVWTLSDLYGRTVLTGQWLGGEGSIAVTGLPVGLYVLHLRDDYRSGVWRISVSR